jgi:hypothetical protein
MTWAEFLAPLDSGDLAELLVRIGGACERMAMSDDRETHWIVRDACYFELAEIREETRRAYLTR